jgi:perosamine synthetase
MLVCNNAEAARTAKLLRWFGIDRDAKRAARWQPYVAREITHDIERLGHKRQMTDLAAALGLGGLRAYDRIIAAREAIFDIYRDIRIPGFRLVDAAPGKKNVYWLATAIVDRRDAFVEKLQGHGIETNTVHVRNDIYRIFGGNRNNLPVMNDLEESYISIPIHNHMTTDDAFYIRKAIEEGW